MLFNKAHIVGSPPEAPEPYINHFPYAEVKVNFVISTEHLIQAVATYRVKHGEPETAQVIADYINDALYEGGIDSLWAYKPTPQQLDEAKLVADKFFPSSVPFTTRNH